MAATGGPAPVRWQVTPLLAALLALLVLSGSVFCAVTGYVLARQADDRRSVERRTALIGAIEDARRSGADFSAVDPRLVAKIAQTAGLKDLRYDGAPSAAQGLENQPAFDRQGRIVGWFSWRPDRSMSEALGRLTPPLALTGLLLIGFAALALWQVRRALFDLGRSERLAWMLAREDMLTGLPNRRKMIERIDALLAARAPDKAVTLAIIDLDGLKDTNDTLGHRAGDALLVAFAARLAQAVPEGAVCGRFDGDEFAVLATAPHAAAAEAAIRTVTAALARPFWVDGQVIQVAATAGFAVAPPGGATRDELLRRADLALRVAKRSQRGGTLRFERAMDVEFDRRRFFERELKRALAEGALKVHYQPIVSSDGTRVVGAEALLRWDHPERGAVAPADFVAAAERSGLMGRLGEFVLRRAVADLRRWPDLYVAVNLSPVQVRDPALVELVAGTLAEHGVAASRLMLEITEGVLFDNPDEAQARLEGLQALGVRLALDDFGTGYSSLTYLQRFRFDKLKIDKSFVERLGRAPDGQAVVQAIVALGRALGVSLLAEGVETEEQRVLLRLAGCQELQGFLFGRPGPREALDRLVRLPRARSAAVRPTVRAAAA